MNPDNELGLGRGTAGTQCSQDDKSVGSYVSNSGSVREGVTCAKIGQWTPTSKPATGRDAGGRQWLWVNRDQSGQVAQWHYCTPIKSEVETTDNCGNTKNNAPQKSKPHLGLLCTLAKKKAQGGVKV